ncbi:MAG: M48 family metallopeptidase [Gammaproteobacteria bacterium]|nr:M48 family metallopeptidase [Gammaproteobacteria bacterium]
MDFFKHQDQARHKTGVLVLLFILAVIFIVVAVNIVAFLLFSTGDDYVSKYNHWMENIHWEHPTALAVLLIFTGSLRRYFALSDGGKAVAEMVGASLVDLNSSDKKIKKYINIVSEMSIASGVPMPVLYVMERESGINAFVAGFRSTEAVMVVTRGALNELDRDELQGVVAHEFSHILNGDMRINIRLMAVLAGILTIGQFGRVLMRSGSDSRHSRNGGPAILIGLLFFLIGYIGLISGRLIKAAISRQREYLADASAVQFTRNPSGIAGALYKIKENNMGSFLQSNQAEEMSHMCFSKTMNIWFGSLMSTHPDLETRINTIDPSFIKIQNARSIIVKRKFEEEQKQASDKLKSHDIAGLIGSPQPQHLAYAAMLYKAFSPSLLNLLHTPEGAQCLIYALLISAMKDDRGLNYLHDKSEQDIVEVTRQAITNIKQIDKRNYLPIVDLVLPVIKNIENNNKQKFIEIAEGLVRLDQHVTMFEFVLLVIVKQHLSNNSEKVVHVKFHSFKHVMDDVRVLVSLLVQTSRQANEKCEAVFKRTMKTFGVNKFEMMPVNQCNFQMLTEVLNRLNSLSPMLKKTLITVCVDCVLDDGIIMPAEAELLRAVAESLDCPMPPLLQSV